MSIKVSIDQLDDMPRFKYQEKEDLSSFHSLYSFEDEGHNFDFIWCPKEKSNKLFVFFSGDALREKLNPPVFQRWKWADKFPGHCIFFSDPSLYLDDKLGLAWYSGTDNFDPLASISSFLLNLVNKKSINVDNIVSYGSSGGGFAALRLASFIEGINVVAINPQTNIVAYDNWAVERYLRVCYGGIDRAKAINDFSDKFNLLSNFNKERISRSNILYVQNRLDSHHMLEHYYPFSKEKFFLESSKYKELIFCDNKGHGVAESNSNLLNGILKLLNI